ncbi:MAG: dipeptidase [Leptospirales bacterium]|nr:dipeptidase [Leptospirales bacterium]
MSWRWIRSFDNQLAAFLFSACAALHCGPEQAPHGDDLRPLRLHFERQPALNFATFLSSSLQLPAPPMVSQTIRRYQHGDALQPEQQTTLYRLLALQARTSRAAHMLDDLARLVALPTYRRDGLAPYQNPAIIKAGQELQRMARENGLQFFNRQNRIFEIRLRGQSDEEFGMYAHVDVVPAIAQTWGLPDGTPLNPFQLREIDGRLYGRGTEDDKCSIVAAIHAMGAARSSGLNLRRGVRLLVETTEETGGEGIRYYKDHYSLPPYNIGLDSAYPVVVAEKGFGALRLRVPAPAASNSRSAPLYTRRLQGAPAINQVPGQAAGEWQTADGAAADALLDRVRQLAEGIAGDEDLRLELRSVGDRLLASAYGISAHGMEPQKGKNALPLLLEFACVLSKNQLSADDTWSRAACAATELFGRDYLGRGLDLQMDHDWMGPYTLALTQIQGREDGSVELGANARLPAGRSATETIALAQAAVDRFNRRRQLQLQMEYQQVDALMRNPEGAWVRTLLAVYSGVSGREGRPISSAGATTARELPNGINFGPSFPDQKYMGHNDNEFKTKENFLFDLQMFTEMIMRIGNLERMQ